MVGSTGRVVVEDRALFHANVHLRFGWTSRSLLLIALGLLGACARESPILADLPAFAGTLRIVSEGDGEGRSLVGRLQFDRSAKTTRFAPSVPEGSPAVEWLHDGTRLTKTIDGKPATLDLQDEADFALLTMVLGAQPTGVDVIERAPGRCVLKLGERRLWIEWK
jgi:hypothetical protein